MKLTVFKYLRFGRKGDDGKTPSLETISERKLAEMHYTSEKKVTENCHRCSKVLSVTGAVPCDISPPRLSGISIFGFEGRSRDKDRHESVVLSLFEAAASVANRVPHHIAKTCSGTLRGTSWQQQATRRR
jgi:hypothetical protein